MVFNIPREVLENTEDHLETHLLIPPYRSPHPTHQGERAFSIKKADVSGNLGRNQTSLSLGQSWTLLHLLASFVLFVCL